MIIAGREVDAAYALEGPAGLLYAVFIILSTLRLDFRLSLFTGVVAAVLRSMEERSRVVAAFGQQVSPEIVEALLAGGDAMESRRASVCILFMDIRDFTRAVEHKTPQEIVAYQNAVFGAAVEVVNRRRGVINQFLGDGLMATFGAPVATGHECAHALAAARELFLEIDELSKKSVIPPTRLGIGLHAGEAVVGNIGTQARRQYSVSGNVVIVAARIEQLNKDYGSQLLVSAEVLRAAGEALPADGALGRVRVKGRDEPVELYRLR